MDNTVEKWMFKEQWCKSKGLSPYDSYFWNLAEQAWKEKHE